VFPLDFIDAEFFFAPLKFNFSDVAMHIGTMPLLDLLIQSFVANCSTVLSGLPKIVKHLLLQISMIAIL
jgi:hypothetical protein